MSHAPGAARLRREPPTALDWSKFRLTRARVFCLSAIMLAVAIVVTVAQFAAARDYILPAGTAIGGDYVAFDVAATAASEGAAASAYDQQSFESLLLEHGPPRKRYGLTWQYPPTYFLLIAPLALLSYGAGYAAWTGGTILFFFGTLRAAGACWLALFVVLSSPTVFQAAVTGQNGFLTAGLLLAATLLPKRRPVVAGLAAALLTVKPQLGILLPVAFAAAGCWRAFAVAAAGAAALVLAATLAYGVTIWPAFAGGLGGAADHLAAARMPLFKMTTPYAALLYAGLPSAASAVGAAAIAAAAVATTAIVWRRIKDAELRAAALLALVFFAAPYGFYYELTIVLAALALVAKRALAQGWLKGEQASLVGLYLLTMSLPGAAAHVGVSSGFLVVLAAAAVVFRRVHAEAPGAFAVTSASAASPARPD